MQQKALFDGWINGTLAEYRKSEPAKRYSSLDEYLAANAFFITGTFHRAKMAKRKWDHGFTQSDTQLEMDAFHNLYHAVARKALGTHWGRQSKANQRMLAIVAMDHPEAKFGRTAGSATTNLHWHVILVARSDNRDAVANALDDPELLAAFKHRTLVDSLDVKPWLAGSTKDYLLKAFIKSVDAPNTGIDDLRVYPKPSTLKGLGWGYLVERNHRSKSLQRLIVDLEREAISHALYGRFHGVPHWELN
jgi:hypothetical protein